jgi:general secretion pathway protein J
VDGGPGRPKPESGFTLLEILIAISIFAVVVTTVFGSFHGVFGQVGILQESMDSYEMAKNCLDRMMTDLQAIHVAQPPAYSLPENDTAPDPYRIVGKTEEAGGSSFGHLRFASLAHVPLERHKRSGIAEIVYHVTAEPDGSFMLRRSDRLDPAGADEPESAANDPILCEGLRSVAFTFINTEGDLQESWDSDSDAFDYQTPQAVRIRLVLGMAETPYVFETAVVLPQFRGPREGEP